MTQSRGRFKEGGDGHKGHYTTAPSKASDFPFSRTMTITKAQSTPLIAVVGATGVQGGSVIKALSESDKPYRIRGFTRDVAKPAAEALKKRGVELVAVNLVLENKEEVYKVFVGTDYAFVSSFNHV
jgi:hypothetical protein